MLLTFKKLWRNNMLILTRKPNQDIIVNSDIIVSVLQIKPDQVRLGIKAPINYTAHRKEIYEKIIHNKLAESNTLNKEFYE